MGATAATDAADHITNDQEGNPMSEQPTPQEIGTHALAKAVEYADKADRYANSTYGSAEFHDGRITTYSRLATVYADVAKAAAALTTNNV